MCKNLVAALCSELWQKRNRTSFNPLVKAYLPDMVIKCRTPSEVGEVED